MRPVRSCCYIPCSEKQPNCCPIPREVANFCNPNHKKNTPCSQPSCGNPDCTKCCPLKCPRIRPMPFHKPRSCRPCSPSPPRKQASPRRQQCHRPDRCCYCPEPQSCCPQPKPCSCERYPYKPCFPPTSCPPEPCCAPPPRCSPSRCCPPPSCSAKPYNPPRSCPPQDCKPSPPPSCDEQPYCNSPRRSCNNPSPCNCKQCQIIASCTPLCVRCGCKVYAAEKITLSKGAYHNSCFSCYCCQRCLDIKSVYEAEGEIYCKRCYNLSFGADYIGFGSTLHPC
nr:unnamed protein product [Callosobruchus chinensis]